jgi:hypothetical protein
MKTFSFLINFIFIQILLIDLRFLLKYKDRLVNDKNNNKVRNKD